MKLNFTLILILSLFIDSVYAQEKIVVKSAEGLPTHSYQLPLKNAAQLVNNNDAIINIANQLKENCLSDIQKYDIQDNASLRNIYDQLILVALIEKDYQKAITYIQTFRNLADKEAEKLTGLIEYEAYCRVAHENKVVDSVSLGEKLIELYENILINTNYNVLKNSVEENKGYTQIYTEGMLYNHLNDQIQKSLDHYPVNEVPENFVTDIMNIYCNLNYYLKFTGAFRTAYDTIIARHYIETEKNDIWASREVDLPKNDKTKNAVVVGIWDTGTDVPVLPRENRWTNPKESFNNQDSDNNGFIDDVFGTSYNFYGLKTTGYLNQVADTMQDIKKYQNYMKGFDDLMGNINSEEATKVLKHMGELKDSNEFFEKMTLYSIYAHGTHVAGIASAGNPYAKILSARLDWDYRNIPESPTRETAENWANMFRETINYFKANNVRVVNMSWTVDYNYEFLRIFELNGTGENNEERKRMAKELFEIEKEGFLQGIQSAPEILFVCAAGNDNNNTDFIGAFPASLNLPNLITVGAVDIEGRKTSFTTEGESIDVYANGFEVESYVPGGDRMAFSGTSMASPNVVNLTAKILAVNPELKPEEVVDIIIKTSTKSEEDENVLLIHPKKAVELAFNYSIKN